MGIIVDLSSVSHDVRKSLILESLSEKAGSGMARASDSHFEKGDLYSARYDALQKCGEGRIGGPES